MLKLKTEISVKTGTALNREIEDYIQKKKKIPCKGLNRRPVFLAKYLEAINSRRDRTRRKQRFFSGVELIIKGTKIDLTGQQKTHHGISYEFRGTTSKGIEVSVHIREETEGKDRKLYLISTF